MARTPALTSSGSPAGSSTPPLRSADSSFSQMRGTLPQAVGRTSGSTCAIWRTSGTDVIAQPNAIDAE